MGYYINPKGESKEAFLERNGLLISQEAALGLDFHGDYLPVCLVDNGAFTAAGIGYHKAEAEAFAVPDRRPKRWYAVKRELLKEFM